MNDWKSDAERAMERCPDWPCCPDGCPRCGTEANNAASDPPPPAVTVLHIDSADTVVVFRLPPNASEASAHRIVDKLRASMPPALKCLVIDGGVAITIASASDVTKAAT